MSTWRSTPTCQASRWPERFTKRTWNCSHLWRTCGLPYGQGEGRTDGITVRKSRTTPDASQRCTLRGLFLTLHLPRYWTGESPIGRGRKLPERYEVSSPSWTYMAAGGIASPRLVVVARPRQRNLLGFLFGTDIEITSIFVPAN